MTIERDASVDYPGDGSTVLWDFNFVDGYLDPSFVKAKIIDNETNLELPFALTDENFEGPFRLRIEPAVGTDKTLRIYRDTPSEPLVNWLDRERIDRAGLDVAARQAMHRATEAAENQQFAIDAGDRAEAAALAAEQAAASIEGDVEDAQAAAASAEEARDVCEADRAAVEAIYQDLLDNPPSDAGITASLTKDSVILAADIDGVVTDFSPANGRMDLYNGNAKIDDAFVTYTITSQTGCTAAIDAAGQYNVTAISADSASVTFRGTYSGVQRTKKMSIARCRAGIPGDGGQDGNNAATVVLYQRGSTAPAVIDNDVTYTFATAALSGSLDGWSVSIPSGTLPIWAIVASFVGTGATDTVTPAEWTTPQIISQNGQDGLNVATVFLFQRTSSATPPSLPSATVTYTFATGVATGMNNGWTQNMPGTGGSYRWITTATAAASTATDSIPNTEWAAAQLIAQDGAGGADGLNTAVVNLYQRSVSAPSGPTATVTYTFSTAVATGLSGGWTQTIPAGSDPIWCVVASAVSAGTSDTITSGEWTSAIKLAESGVGGADGINTATVFLFQRTTSSTPPAKPASAVTYTFATGVATGGLGSWSQTLPTSGGQYAWLTTATAASQSPTDSIPTTEWATVAALAVDGADGQNSATVTVYQRASTAPSVPSGTVTYTFSTALITGLNNGWTQSIPSGTLPLWATVVSFVSTTATDTATSGEWSTPVKVSENGIHSATVFLYKRTTVNVAPAAPTTTSTYTFSTAVLTGQNNGWTQGIPDDAVGPYLWVITASAAGVDTTDTILNTEWAPVRRLAADGLDGEDGADAQIMGIYATSQMFTFASDNSTPVPSVQTITFTLVLQNLSGTATWTATKYDANGTSLGAATLGGSGNTRTLTVASFGVAHHAVVTASLGGFNDQCILIRLYPGANGATPVQSDLDNDAHTFPADSSGQVTNYSGGTSRMKVYLGLAEDSTNWTFTKAASAGVTATLGTGANKNLLTVTAMTTDVDSGYVDITATRAGYPTQVKRFSISKAKSAPGTSGLITAFRVSSGDLELDGIQTATALVTLGSDGVITYRQNDVAKNDLNWFAPATVGIGASYWVRAYPSGDTLSSGTTGSWVSLSTSPSWSLLRTPGQGIGVSQTDLLLFIATDSGGVNIVASGRATLTANQDS